MMFRTWYYMYSGRENILCCSILGITCQRPRVLSPLQIATDPNKQTFDYNEYIEFRCVEGYNLIGAAVQQCTQNGIFHQNLPSCSRMYIDCQCFNLT